jgi:hypothetical protein
MPAGFGRIGRLVLRAALAKQGIEVQLPPQCLISLPCHWAALCKGRTPPCHHALDTRALSVVQVVAINDPFIENDYIA